MTQLTRVIQELSPTMLICLDGVAGTILFHNTAFAEKLRYDSEKILDESIFQFVHERSFIPLAKALKSIQAKGEINLKVTLKKSNDQGIEANLQVCRRGEDDFLVYLFFDDISAQAQKDKDLEVYQQIISSSKEIMFLVNTDYHYQVVNQAFLNHFGMKEDRVLQQHIQDVHPEDANILISMLDSIIQTGKTHRFQSEMTSSVTKQVSDIDSILSPYFGKNGEVVGVIACARDISSHIQMSKGIRSSNRYYKTLFEHSPDLLASVSLQTGLILDANRTLETVLGYEKSDLIGQHLFKLHGKAHKKVLAEAIVNLSNNHPINSLEVSLIAKDGNCISADLRTTPIIDEGNSIAIFVWRDTRYQEKLAYKAAHDPLTHLLNRSGFMPLLEKPFESDEKRVLCFIDIDNFKALNDTSGHLSGDEFLIGMADLLRQSISQQDKLCRLGGDEFLILVRQRELDQVYKLMRVVLLKINALVKGERKYLNANLGVSIGLTPFEPDESSRDVLKRADQACYQSKRNGKNQVSVLERSAAV